MGDLQVNIMRSRILIAFAAALLLGASAASAQKSGVAVVDVKKVFESLREWAQAKAQIQNMADLVKLEDQSRQQKLQQMREDLELLPRDTPNYARKLEDFELAALNRNVWLQYQQAKLGREEVSRMEVIYGKIVDATKRVATASGYQMVLVKEKPLKILEQGDQIKDREQLWDKIAERKLIWWSDDLDLTDQVRTKMDNEFIAGAENNK